MLSVSSTKFVSVFEMQDLAVKDLLLEAYHRGQQVRLSKVLLLLFEIEIWIVL